MPVGTLSRASLRRLSDNDIRCRASDRRWFPARPAQHVQRRRYNGKGRIQSAIASAHARDGKRRVGTCNMQRRTRRSASTLVGAAPETIIGRAAADRAGARPYQSQRHRLIKSSNPGGAPPRCRLYDPRSGSNPEKESKKKRISRPHKDCFSTRVFSE